MVLFLLSLRDRLLPPLALRGPVYFQLRTVGLPPRQELMALLLSLRDRLLPLALRGPVYFLLRTVLFFQFLHSRLLLLPARGLLLGVLLQAASRRASWSSGRRGWCAASATRESLELLLVAMGFQWVPQWRSRISSSSSTTPFLQRPCRTSSTSSPGCRGRSSSCSRRGRQVARFRPTSGASLAGRQGGIAQGGRSGRGLGEGTLLRTPSCLRSGTELMAAASSCSVTVLFLLFLL